jgi:hypothetical protein
MLRTTVHPVAPVCAEAVALYAEHLAQWSGYRPCLAARTAGGEDVSFGPAVPGIEVTWERPAPAGRAEDDDEFAPVDDECEELGEEPNHEPEPFVTGAIEVYVETVKALAGDPVGAREALKRLQARSKRDEAGACALPVQRDA